MNRNRTALIISAVILIPLFLFGAAVLASRMYAASQLTTLPEVPTFAYSTPIQLATPLSFGSPLPTIPSALPPLSLSQTAIAQSVTPTATITPLTLFTPTNIVYIGTPVSQYFYYVYPTTYRSPTSRPVPTLSPTATVTLPPPPPAASGPAACNNILYPVKPGTNWGYAVSSGTHAGLVNMSVASVQNSFGFVNVTNTVNGVNSQVQVVCDQDVILSFPFLDAQTLLGNALNGSMTINYAGGVLAPNQAAFLNSNWALSWASQYTIFGSGSVVYHGNTFNIIISPSTMNVTCQTLASGNAAFETITVGAGTFNALKVICTGQGQVTGTANGGSFTGTVTAQSTQWFAPNVGPIRIRADAANLTVFGIVIPLSSGGLGTIDLQSFAPGP